MLKRLPHLTHDPDQAPLPAYYPDAPEVRRDMAQYYDNITTMDGQAAQLLRQLEADGLAGDTIVFFYGDHGACLPRSKRMPYNSGLQVGLLAHIPAKFQHLASRDYRKGGSSDRLVSFVDLGPTMLSLAGIPPPQYMQGRAFLGAHIAAEPAYLHGFRGRMDERVDLMRSTRDRRYMYIRNYMPHRIYGQHVAYQWQEATMQVWEQMYRQGKLHPPRTYFWETKPPEELYDLSSDKDEVKNLSGSGQHRQVLERFRLAQDEWMREIRDIGLMPEAEMLARSQGTTPYQVGHDRKQYPFERVKSAADLASSMDGHAVPELVKRLADPESAVRYWAAQGLVMQREPGIAAGAGALRKALEDSSSCVRIAAAEALARYGSDADLSPSLAVLLDLADVPRHGVFLSVLALNSLDQLPSSKLRTVKHQIASLAVTAPSMPERAEDYSARLKSEILSRLS